MNQAPRPPPDPTRDPALDRRHLVEPEHVEIRLQSAWRRLGEAREDRRERRHRRYLLAGIGGAGLAAAAAAALVIFPPGAGAPAPTAWAGATLRTGGEPTRVALSDGSEIEARPDSELALMDAPAGEVRVALRRGGATFEVTRRTRPRRFVVEAGNVEVRVLGTRFLVDRTRGPDGERRVEVAVRRGLVEVALGDRETRRLGPGERWSVEEAPPPGEPPRAAVSLSEEPEDGDEPPEVTGSRRPDPRPSRRTRRPRTAAELMGDAKAAGRQGDHRAAARAYEALLRGHPRDRRVSLAAFELGRLYMDRLGDRRRAAAAFRRSLSAGRGSPFREDALRRLVEIHDGLGDGASCRRARQRYLADHPTGRYVTEVGRRCGMGR